MNSLKELCLARHSTRRFSKETVSDDLLQGLLEIVQTAPSAGNLQAYQVYVVKNREIRIRLAEAALGQAFIAEAPVVLVFTALPAVSAQRYGERGIKLYSIQDATIACTYAMLAATDLGLACTWVGAFRESEVQQVLGSRLDQLPVAILPLGFGVDKQRTTSRKPLNEMVQEQ